MAKKRFQPKPKIKKGDTVVVIAGSHKYKGVKGKVLAVYPKKNRVLVEGVNIVKKHVKPTETQKGGIIEVEAPIHISNVMYWDEKIGAPTRIGRRIENGKIVRYSKKSGRTID